MEVRKTEGKEVRKKHNLLLGFVRRQKIFLKRLYGFLRLILQIRKSADAPFLGSKTQFVYQ